MTTIGLIPARGGSKGIQKKNITDLAGDPLIAYSIRAANEAESIETTVVSTDDEEIARVAENYDARVPFMRPEELATDEVSNHPVIEHALQTLRVSGETYDSVALLQPTSPLRTSEHIDEAHAKFVETEADSLISVYQTYSNRWEKASNGAKQINYIDKPTRRQDRTPEYVSNGSISIIDVNAFLATQKKTAGTTTLYEMEEARSIDVDTEFDLWMAEKILTEWFTQ